MSTKTKFLRLIKDAKEDKYSIDTINENLERIDQGIDEVDKKLKTKVPLKQTTEMDKADPNTYNYLMYDYGNGNNCGIGCDHGGGFRIRTGLSEDNAHEITFTTNGELYLDNNKLNVENGKGTFIDKDTDLNDERYWNPGKYCCATNEWSRTLKNCPTKDAFTMEVVLATGDEYPTQIITTYIDGTTYRRLRDPFSKNIQTWYLMYGTYRYTILENVDILTQPQGDYYVYGNCTNLPEYDAYFCTIKQYDSKFKTIELIPSELKRRCRYMAKCLNGCWGSGWEKYAESNLVQNTQINDPNRQVSSAVTYSLQKQINIYNYSKVDGTINVAPTLLGNPTGVCSIWLEGGVYIISSRLKTTFTKLSQFEIHLYNAATNVYVGDFVQNLPAGYQEMKQTDIIKVNGASNQIVLQCRQNDSNIPVTGIMEITKIK